MKVYHFTNSRKVKSILENGLLPKFGKRSKFIKDTTRPKICFFTSRKEAENNWYGWLSYTFGTDVEVSLIQAEINKKNLIFYGNKNSFIEAVSYKPIGSNRLKVINIRSGHDKMHPNCG
jgi:hypothetical protein